MTSAEHEVVEHLKGRSAPCPRCTYELRDLATPQCPECGEPLVLKVGSPNTHFAWLLVAAAPGCFSAVATVLLMVPILGATLMSRTPGVPMPILGAWCFGVLSSVSVFVLYRERHRFLRMKSNRQMAFALSVWGVHILAFFVTIAAMVFLVGGPTPPPTPAATSAPAPVP